jgi:Antirestriction protein
MAPDQDEPFEVHSLNGYAGRLSADGLGIAVCLYAYSHLS